MRFTFGVDEVRTFSEGSMKRYFVKVPVANLPPDLPTDVNARAQNLQTGVARAIRRSLMDPERSEIFHLLNRGLVITASSVTYDNKARELTVDLLDKDLHGVLDGGHTYAVTQKYAPEDTEARVMMEILTGVEEYQADIVEARNTSTQVEAYALANVRNEFDPILSWLDDHGVPRQRIRVKQFDTDGEISILDILAIMYLFDIDTFGSDLDGLDTPPLLAYSGKGSVLKHFERHQDTFTKKMLPLLPDILWLWDYIDLRCLAHYRHANPVGRIGRRRGNEVGTRQGDFMPGLSVDYTVHRAYKLPLMAAMRCLVDSEDNDYRWRDVDTKPLPHAVEQELGRKGTMLERFYDAVAPKLWVPLQNEIAVSTPNKIGKSGMLWSNLFMIAWRDSRSDKM